MAGVKRRSLLVRIVNTHLQSDKREKRNHMVRNRKHVPSSSKLHHALAKPLAFLHVPGIFF